MKLAAVLVTLSCIVLANTKRVHKENVISKVKKAWKDDGKLNLAQRDVDLTGTNGVRKEFGRPSSGASAEIVDDTPENLRELLNQALDFKGGRQNYKNIFINTYTTNQVNNELEFDGTFNAVVNRRPVHCTAHIVASTPSNQGGIHILIPAESYVHCLPNSARLDPRMGDPDLSYSQPPQPSSMGYVPPEPIGVALPPPMGIAQPPPLGYAQPPPIGIALPPPIGFAQPNVPPIGYAQPPPIGIAQPPPMGFAQPNVLPAVDTGNYYAVPATFYPDYVPLAPAASHVIIKTNYIPVTTVVHPLDGPQPAYSYGPGLPTYI